MIQSATFSMQQSQSILKTYLIDYDITKVVQKFIKREANHLRDHLKRIIRETIINIEAQLFKAQKIPYLLLYDNQSDQMFEEFLNLKDILQDSEKDNFYLNFVNMKSEGCRILRFGRTDYHVSINSEQRERIYASFINYTEVKKLYKFAVTAKQQSPISNNGPYLDPTNLFSLRDLQFVFKVYTSKKGDTVAMANAFKQRGVTGGNFQLQNLQQSIQNLMLIGCFNGYKKHCSKVGAEPMKWDQFKDKYPLPEQADMKAKCMLVRVAIRNDPQPGEMRWFDRYQKKKLPNLRHHQTSQIPKKGANYKFKKWRKQQQKAEQKIFGVMNEQIQNQNQHPSQYFDSKSFRSMSSRRNERLLKQQRKKRQYCQQQYDDHELKQPKKLKKSSILSHSQHIQEEQDEKDVIWQEIPQKCNSNQQNQSNISISGKYYSEKLNHEKLSKGVSLRSQKFKGMNVRPKKVCYSQNNRNKKNNMMNKENYFEDSENSISEESIGEDYEIEGDQGLSSGEDSGADH